MLDTELKTAFDSLQGETKTAFLELKNKYDTLDAAYKALQIQTDAIDAAGQQGRRLIPGDTGAPSGMEEFKRLVVEHKEAFDPHGRIRFDIKTLLPETKSQILSTGITSTLPAVGIQGGGRYPFRLRQLFQTVPTSLPSIGVLRTTSESLNASPQVEGATKAESTMTFGLVQVPVQTIATFINFSKQAMDDVDGFAAFVNATLVWALERKAESEVLSGDGSGVHLSGLTTNAVAFDTTILTGGTAFAVDTLGAAAVQLQEGGWNPDFCVISPRAWFRMVAQKSTTGEYILATPQTTVGRQVYELQVVVSPAMLGTSFFGGRLFKGADSAAHGNHS